MSKKMGNMLGHTEGAHPVNVPTPLKTSVPSPKPRGAALPGSIVHTPTPRAGNMPGEQRSGMEQAMGAHADILHPVGKRSMMSKGAPRPMMAGEATNDKIKSGGY